MGTLPRGLGHPLGLPQGAGVPTPLSQPEKGVPSTQVGCPWGRNLQPACRHDCMRNREKTQCLALLVAALAVNQCFSLGLGWEEFISQCFAHHAVSRGLPDLIAPAHRQALGAVLARLSLQSKAFPSPSPNAA